MKGSFKPMENVEGTWKIQDELEIVLQRTSIRAKNSLPGLRINFKQ